MSDREVRYAFLRRLRGLRRFGASPRLIPEGVLGVALIGHRDYVGGMWETMGHLQFEFMVDHGLRPEHRFLDIACGSLRGGVHFIRYLDPGNYLGIEKEGTLVQRGIKKELSPALLREKRPEFVVSGAFEFHKFSTRTEFSLAQSLFTHLTPADIARCLGNLRANVMLPHECYATFARGRGEVDGTRRSHSRGGFYYTPEQLGAIGESCGWKAEYIGDWGHPRKQVMMRFLAS